MTPEKLYSVICPKFGPYVEAGWQKIIVNALVEKSTGGSDFSYVNKAGDKIELQPSDYMPDLSVYLELQEFVSYINVVEDTKCNTIVFEMFPNGSYQYQSLWDEDKHQLDIDYREAILKSSRKPDSIQAVGSIQESKKNYELILDVDHNLKRVLMLDFSKNKMIGQFYTRLFTLFGPTKHKMYEGFSYFIKDKTNDIIIGAELTASGLGYHAADDSETTIEALNNFHSFLFTPELELLDTELTIENDFGHLKIGCINGVIFEFQIEE